MPNVLFVTTSHDKLGDTGRATGVWLEELAVPYYMFLDAGHAVTVATVDGGRMPVDPRSVMSASDRVPAVQRFLEDAHAMAAVEATPAVEGLRAGDYDVTFLPGGHGAVWDLPGSRPLALAVGEAFDQQRVIAALCHGVAGLVSARRRDGGPIVAGRRVAGFTNAEEEAETLTAIVPFLLETHLRELGARFESGPDFESFAIRDGQLITGQNPASSAEVAQLVLQTLDEQRSRSNPASTQQKQEPSMSSSESLTRRDAVVADTVDQPPATAAPADAKAVMMTLRLSANNGDAFKRHLLKVIPVTRLASGCRFSHSYQHSTTPNEFLLIQGWDSLEQQQAYIAWRQARGDLAQFGAFLGQDAVIETFDLFDA